MNVHPSLLPAFPGLGAIEQALEHGVKVTGVTVHFVDEGVDSGPIILQEAFELPYPSRHRGDRGSDVHDVEHRLLPRAVRLIAAGRVRSTRTTRGWCGWSRWLRREPPAAATVARRARCGSGARC